MDNNILEVVKLVLQYAVAPLAAFFIWMYKKQHTRVDKLEERIIGTEQSVAVIKVMIDNIKDDIREIKHGITKLVDRNGKI